MQKFCKVLHYVIISYFYSNIPVSSAAFKSSSNYDYSCRISSILFVFKIDEGLVFESCLTSSLDLINYSSNISSTISTIASKASIF